MIKEYILKLRYSCLWGTILAFYILLHNKSRQKYTLVIFKNPLNTGNINYKISDLTVLI